MSLFHIRLKQNAWERLIPPQEEFKDFILAEEEEPFLDVTMSISKDEDILESLITRYSSFSYVQQEESIFNKTLGFSVHDADSLSTVVSDIARQQNKLIRVSNNVVSTIPLNLNGTFIGLDPDLERSIITFNQSNIHGGTLVLTATSLSDVITNSIVRFLSNNWLEYEEYLYKESNLDKYGNREQEEEYYTNITRAAAETTRDYWSLYEGDIYFIVQFDSYLDTIKVEINDIVKIDLANLILDWHVPPDTGAVFNEMPFSNFHRVSAADDSFIGSAVNGLVKEVSLKMDEGLISYTVWIPVLVGGK
jgi:hypothetical protein